MEKNQTTVAATARLNGCGMSARKMRLVADIIRGAKVDKALGILKFTRREGARWIEKLLASAIANWGVLTQQEPEEFGLVLKTIWVDQAPQLKRFRPAPHGRAHRIRKHYCHVTLVVENTTALPVEEKTTEDTTAVATV